VQGARATGQEQANRSRQWRTQVVCPPSPRRVGGARGRERAGPTRSHPEPGRDPAQRRRVLWGRPHGRRGRRGHPPPADIREWACKHYTARGGAAAARWAHNPKVGGSNPSPATTNQPSRNSFLEGFVVPKISQTWQGQDPVSVLCDNRSILMLTVRGGASNQSTSRGRRLCCRSRLSQTMRRLRSPWVVALRRMRRTIATFQPAVV